MTSLMQLSVCCLTDSTIAGAENCATRGPGIFGSFAFRSKAVQQIYAGFDREHLVVTLDVTGCKVFDMNMVHSKL